MKVEPKTLNVYGIKFTNIDPKGVLKAIETNDFNEPKYVCFPSTNIVSKVRDNKSLQDVFNTAWMTLPDGMMTQYYARLKGIKKLKMVSGFWLLTQLLNKNYTHYFYGVTDEVLLKIEKKINSEFPTARVLGYKSPPYVELEEIEQNEQINNDILEIRKLNADIIWIGITNLKQDLLMNIFHKQLNRGVMIGVGAVFLYLSGEVKMGPVWVKKLALRWLIRLIQEPKKEAKSLPSTFYFLFLMFKEFILRQSTRN